MVTITQGNTAKLKERIFKQEVKKFERLYDADRLYNRKEKYEIQRSLENHIKSKVYNFYKSKETEMESSDHVISGALKELSGGKNADSKAEKILYFKLQDQGIPFYFQYPIGPYYADFLVNEILDLELDGPVHNQLLQKKHDARRDKYFKQMGYKVLRVPIWLFAMDEQAVFEEILELIK